MEKVLRWLLWLALGGLVIWVIKKILDKKHQVVTINQEEYLHGTKPDYPERQVSITSLKEGDVLTIAKVNVAGWPNAIAITHGNEMLGYLPDQQNSVAARYTGYINDGWKLSVVGWHKVPTTTRGLDLYVVVRRSK